MIFFLIYLLSNAVTCKLRQAIILLCEAQFALQFILQLDLISKTLDQKGSYAFQILSQLGKYNFFLCENALLLYICMQHKKRKLLLCLHLFAFLWCKCEVSVAFNKIIPFIILVFSMLMLQAYLIISIQWISSKYRFSLASAQFTTMGFKHFFYFLLLSGTHLAPLLGLAS